MPILYTYGSDTSPVYESGYAFAMNQLMTGFVLGTVLFGMLTMSLMMVVYATLRPGIRPFTTQVKLRLSHLAAAVLLYALYAAHWTLSVKHMRDLLFGGWIGYNFIEDGLAAAQALYTTFGPYVLECVMFGVFCTLIPLAVYVFARKSLRARPQQVMLGVALLMFAISLVHWALQTRFIVVNYEPEGLDVPHGINPSVVPLVLVSINVVISDAIVLWRMCVLWKQHRGAIILAAGLLASTIAISIANVVQEMRVLASEPPDLTVFAQPAYSDSVYGTAALVLSLATNATATALVAWKTWYYRRRILDQMSTINRLSIVAKVMTLLVESGCVYCATWVLYIIASKSAAFDITAALVYTAQAKDANGNVVSSIDYPNDITIAGVGWLNRLMAQLTGIYPTIILVLVALEQNHFEDAFSASKVSAFLPAKLDFGTLSGSFRQIASDSHRNAGVGMGFDAGDFEKGIAPSVTSTDTDVCP